MNEQLLDKLSAMAKIAFVEKNQKKYEENLAPLLSMFLAELCNHLGIPKNKIPSLDFKLKDSDAEGRYYFRDGENRISLNSSHDNNCKDFVKKLITLVHESRHAWQVICQPKEFFVIPAIVDDKILQAVVPEEIDAREFSWKYIKKLGETLSNEKNSGISEIFATKIDEVVTDEQTVFNKVMEIGKPITQALLRIKELKKRLAKTSEIYEINQSLENASFRSTGFLNEQIDLYVHRKKDFTRSTFM